MTFDIHSWLGSGTSWYLFDAGGSTFTLDSTYQQHRNSFVIHF